jgi:hypothetical protein
MHNCEIKNLLIFKLMNDNFNSKQPSPPSSLAVGWTSRVELSGSQGEVTHVIFMNKRNWGLLW